MIAGWHPAGWPNAVPFVPKPSDLAVSLVKKPAKRQGDIVYSDAFTPHPVPTFVVTDSNYTTESHNG